MRPVIKIQILLVLLLIAVQSYGQEAGRTFIRNFLPQEYRASLQNWAIVQDRRGIMYFGNNDGLLEYDGVSWRLTKLPGVRSLAVDSAGRIYTGLENDIGYLEPDGVGTYIYHSLKESIPDSDRDLTTVFRVFILGDLVTFQTNERFFLFHKGKIKVIRTSDSYHLSFTVHNKFYIREAGKGLFRLEGDSLLFVKGSEQFATERIYAMLPYGDNEILIAGRTKGILIYSPENQPAFFKSDKFKEVDRFLLANPVYCGTMLAGGDMALGAMTGGIIIFNTEGKIIDRYNKNNGMQDNTILWLYSDKNQQLWAALDNGISLIQNNIPFRYYSEANGLNGATMTMKFFNNHFYVGTGQSLHVQNSKGNFERIAGTESQNFCLYEAGGRLLLAHYNGVYELRGNNVVPVKNNIDNSFLSFCQVLHKPQYLISGAGDGLYLLQEGSSSWEIKHKIKGFYKSPYKVDMDKEGNIWVSTMVELYKLRIDNTLDSIISIKQYKSEQGLPSDYACPFTLRSGEVVFCSDKGIYHYVTEKDRLERHPDFLMLTGKVIPFEQAGNGDVWFDQLNLNGDHEKGVLRYQSGEYSQYMTPFYKFGTIGSSDTPFNICPAPDGSIFFGATIGLLQYDPRKEFNTGHSFRTLIRSVYSSNSLLFGGAQLTPSDTIIINGKSLPYSQHDLVFNFAAAFFEDSEKNLYSCRMDGLDTAWSVWTVDHKKEYINLHEGNYTFRVKSKNQYQTPGSIASYSFTILPPWYRTWLSYIIYAVFCALAVWLIVKLNIRRLVKQRDHLEKVVTERTAEIVEQKKEINEKNEELSKTNTELNTTLDIVNNQKKQIETAHEEITASINYAKYIQSSLFPKTDQLKSCLGEHFILHKPKEIVSGDFYWVSETGNKTVIAAADCTGHGVPGAFMSMLGITLLNEIVNKESVINPGVILDHLRMEVTASLKQKGQRWEQKDGMDIALCTIDRENMKLHFAGAINPLYMIRKSGMENAGAVTYESNSNDTFVEIKGNHMPIGISDEMHNFVSHEIDIYKGDTFYLFSDGFPDQFGGPDHKKFSYKRFRDQFIKIKEETMSDQKSILEKVLSEWIGNNNQTDDILVIGFRIN